MCQILLPLVPVVLILQIPSDEKSGDALHQVATIERKGLSCQQLLLLLRLHIQYEHHVPNAANVLFTDRST